jgi:formate dehydrogenase gamma subunit
MRSSLTIIMLAGVLGGANTLFAQSSSECLSCHGENSLTMEKKGKAVSLYVNKAGFEASAHGTLDCVACHENFKPTDLPHRRKITPVNCLNCHDGAQGEKHKSSVHGVAKKGGRAPARCVDCHTAHAVKKLSGESSADREQFVLETCTKCHANVNTRYMDSDHGRALAAGVQAAPSCIDCHNEHDVKAGASEDAGTNRQNQAAMCLRCHLDNPDVRARVSPSVGFISSYEKSVHAKGLAGGNEGAATCTDCHGGHDLKKGSNPASTVARKNIATTCGQCHGDVLEQYQGSIHGTAFARGVEASATCTDCHGEHSIFSPKDTASPVSAGNVSAQVCSPCHASVKLTQKFGLAADRFQSFSDSYHGLAGKGGSVEVANCASCHGIHDIKPSSDPSSRIHKDNLVRTCGTCHPGANDNFTKGAVHILVTKKDDGILYLISTTYIILIITIVGGMTLHNILDFVKKSKRQLMYRRGLLPHPKVSHRLYLRMTLSERIQHGALLGSFFTLVLTGFALKFPDAWWVAPIRDVSPFMFEIRGVMHRIAAVVMVVAGLYHLYYILGTPRGKQLLRDLIPVPQDIRDAINVLRYNLGISREKPQFGRFSYIEKSEYWALMWGTVVMAVTGVILWFDNTFLGILTKLWWDAAQTVHYYEAWLATLSIIVWHFYFVIFNPDSYPLNLAFWKGTLTEEEMEEEHPHELEEIRRREAEGDD